MKKIMKHKNQKGIGLMTLVFGIAVLGILIIYGSQIGLGYLDQQTIRGATRSALMDLKSDDSVTPKKIRDTILTKISTNTIELKGDDIVVNREGTGFNVTIDYTKEIKVTKDIKIVMDLGVNESTP